MNAISKLKTALSDKDYKLAWTANLAMAYIDSERWYRQKHNKIGKYLNYKDRHTIANEAAEYFINQLCN